MALDIKNHQHKTALNQKQEASTFLEKDALVQATKLLLDISGISSLITSLDGKTIHNVQWHHAKTAEELSEIISSFDTTSDDTTNSNGITRTEVKVNNITIGHLYLGNRDSETKDYKPLNKQQLADTLDFIELHLRSIEKLSSINNKKAPNQEKTLEEPSQTDIEQTTLDSIGMGTFDLTLKTNQIVLNRTAKKILGYEDHENPINTYQELTQNIHPKQREKFIAVLSSFFKREIKQIHLIVKIKTRANLYLWIILTGGFSSHRITKKPKVFKGAFFNINKQQLAHEKLITSQERLNQIFSHSNILNWEINCEGKYTFISENTKRITGYTQREIIGEYVHRSSFNPKETHCNTLHHLIKHTPDTNIISEFECQFITKDGRTLYYLNNIVPKFNSKGNIVGYYGISKDITTIVEQQRKINDTETTLQNVINHSSSWYWKIDNNLCYTDISKGIENIMGYKYSEIIGTSFLDKLENDKSDDFLKTMKSALKRKDHIISINYCKLNKEGKKIHLSTDAFPKYSSTGELLECSGFSKDITSIKENEEEVRQSKEKLQTALQAAETGLWEYYPQNKNFWTNSINNEILGYPAEAEIYNEIEDLFNSIHPDDRDEVKKINLNYAQGKITKHRHERRQKCADGSYIWIDSVGKVVEWDKDKKPVRIMGVHLSIEQRKRHEQTIIDNELKLNIALNSINTGIIITDTEHRITRINPVAEKLTDWTKSRALGKKIDRVLLLKVDYTSKNSDKSIINKLLQSEKSKTTSSEILASSKDQKLYYVSLSAAPIMYHDGTKRGSIINFQNVSEQTLAHEKLSKLNIQNEDALRIANAGAFYIDFEKDSKLINNGEQPEHLQSRTDKQFSIKQWSDKVIHMDKPYGINPYEYALSVISNPNIYSSECEYKRLSDLTQKTIWVRLRASIIRHKDGKPKFMSGVTQDITEQKENLLHLEKSKKTAMDALNLSKSKIWKIDTVNNPNTIVIEVQKYDQENKHVIETEKNYSFEQVMNSLNSIDKVAALNFSQKLSALKNGSIRDCEMIIGQRNSKTDNPNWIKLVASTSINEDGHVIAINGISQNITDEREYQLKIEQSNKEAVQAFEMANAGTWRIDLNNRDRVITSKRIIEIGEFKHHDDGNYFYMNEWKERLYAANNNINIKILDELKNIDQNPNLSSSTYTVKQTKKNLKDLIYLIIHAKIEYDTQGKPISVSGYVQDVTAEKTAEKTIKVATKRANKAFRLAKAHTWHIKSEDRSKIYFDNILADPLNNKRKKTFLPAKNWFLKANTQHPEFSITIKEDLEKILNNESSKCSGVYSKTNPKTKETKWFKYSATAYKDVRGEVAGIDGITQDITESYNSQEQIKREKEYSQMVINLMPNGLSIVNIQEGTTFLSKRYTEILGYTLEDLKNKDAKSIISIIHPDDRTLFIEHANSIRSNKQKSEIIYRTKHKHTNKYLWIKEQSNIFEINPDGSVKSITCVFTDITTQYSKDVIIKENEERIRFANRTIGLVTWEWDIPTCTILASSKYKEIYGYDPVKKNNLLMWAKQTHPEDKERCTQKIKEHFDGDTENYQIEYRYKRPGENHYIWIFNAGRVVKRDKKGSPTKIIGVSQEITSRKEQEQKLIDSNYRMSQLFSNMPLGFSEHEIILDEIGRAKDYKYISFNKSYRELTGIKAQVGKTINEIKEEYNSPENLIIFAEVANTGQSTNFTYQCSVSGRYFNINVYSNKKGHFATLWNDVSLNKLNEAEITHQKELSNILTNISSHYINVGVQNINTSIHNALAEMGTYLGANRGIMYSYDRQKGTVRNNSEWCREGYILSIKEPTEVAIKAIAEVEAAHLQGDIHVIQNANDTKSSIIKEVMTNNDIKCRLSVPIFIENTLIGFYGFDLTDRYQTFKQWEISLFKVFAEILANISQRVISEKQRQDQHDYLTTLINTIPDMIFAKDMEGKYTLANPAMQKASNQTYNNFIGKTDHDIFQKDIANKFIKADADIIKHDGPIAVQSQSLLHESKDVYYETVKSPIKNKHGETIGIIGVARDISAQKKHEKYILLTQQRLKAQIKVNEVEVTDIQYYLDYCQDKLTKVTESQHSFVFLKEQENEQFSYIASSMGKHWCKQHSSHNHKEPVEWSQCCVQHNNNDITSPINFSCLNINFDIKNHLSLPISRNNKVIGTVIVVNKKEGYTHQDTHHLSLMMGDIIKKIDAFKHKEEQLKTNNYIKALINNIPISVIVFDRNKKEIILANSTTLEMFELESNTLESDFKQDKNTAKLLQDLHDKIWGQEEFDNKTIEINQYKSKRKIWVSASNKISNFFGRSNISLACLYDISNEKTLQSSLEKAKQKADTASRAKSTFLANMSHEIRTPMNAIIGFSDILSQKLKNQSSLHQIEAIQSSSKALLGIINDILDISKIEAGKLIINNENVDLRSLLDDIRRTFEILTIERGIDLIIKVDEDIPTYIQLDELRLRQVFINLISNSIKFTKAGFIKIAIDIIDDYQEKLNLRIRIIDTGIGISQADQEKIFNAFEQADGQDSRQYEGTGLGLSISTKIIQLFGGSISVSSTLGKGSTFTINLPHVQKVVNQTACENRFQPENIRFNPCKIMVVDDIKHNIDVLRGYFDFHPTITIIEASSGTEAIEAYEKAKPDLIFMDLRMPILDGYKATVIINKKSGGKIPIVALTASAFLGSKREVERKGFRGYLRKPIAYSDLINEITNFIDYKIIKVDSDDKDRIKLIVNESLLPHIATMKTRLNDISNKEWKVISEKQSIKDVKEFVIALCQFNAEYPIDGLIKYTDQLEEAIATFDIRYIKELTLKYPAITKQL